MTIGNAPRVMDYVCMPHQTKYNMAILTEFPIHEQIKLAFRGELYGVALFGAWRSGLPAVL